jgi:hypothetical protein
MPYRTTPTLLIPQFFMANWCDNTVKFSGDEKRLKQVHSLFRRLGRKGKKEMLGQMPNFVSKEKSHFFDISVKNDTIFYVTKWKPNNDVLKEIADHFKLDFTNRYDELTMGIFGEASCQNGIMLDIQLDLLDFQAYDYDKELLAYVYEGNSYEFEWPIFELLLEKKKEQFEQGTNLIPSAKEAKELLFKSASHITLEELTAIYGEMTPGDIVLKFAEHKNYDAAREAFQGWDERSIIEMDNFLIQGYRHEEELYSTRDKYIAMSFLKELINEWDTKHREQVQIRLEDPVQQQKAGELLALRLTGKLPHIDIAGTDFTIDWRLRELRETAAPWNRINIHDLTESESGEEYLALYDTVEKRLYDFDDTITTLPENVVGLEIPIGTVLDPVAVAREHGVDINAFVRENPIRKDLTAVIKPISETGLPELVEGNLRKRTGPGEDSGRKVGR